MRPLSIDLAWEFADDFNCTLDELAGRDFPAEAVRYDDLSQARLNACYENMNADGKRTLVKIASSLERDAENRTTYTGEDANHSDAIAV